MSVTDTAPDKISNTLIQFAQPLLRAFDAQTTVEQAKHAFTFAITLWNAVILDEHGVEEGHLNKVRKRLGFQADPRLLEVVDVLIERKRTLFGDDRRAIQEYDVRLDDDGDLHLYAEAVVVGGETA